MRGRGIERAVKRTIGNQIRDVAEASTRTSGFRVAIFVCTLLAAATWNRWIEPYVDSGRELMVPWRVAEGERLYRDVQFPHGPLAPWLGAACDRLFGRSLPARTALAGGIALFALAALD